MRKLLLLIALLLGAASATPAAAGPVFAVIFEVDLGDSGAVTSLKVSKVTGPEGERLPKKIPDAFIAAARERLTQLYRGRPAGHFFTYLLFDPEQPSNAALDEPPPPSAEEAGPSIAIARGETLTLKLPDGAGAEPVVVSRAGAPAGPASQMEEVTEQMFLTQGRVSQSRLAKPTRLDLPKEPKIAPGLLRLTMKPGPKGTDTVLVVENGYGRMLRYRASIVREGKADAPTSVCEVLPGIVSFEYWPDPLDRLDLGRFELAEVPADRKVACH
jgi:hypothetical protein